MQGSMLSILFLGAALAAAQNESPITRDGAYWVRTIQGAIDTSASDRLRVETTGNVTLRGASWGTEQLHADAARESRRRARSRSAAGSSYREDRDRGRLDLCKGNSAPAGLPSVELTVTGPRGIAAGMGGNARRKRASVGLGWRFRSSVGAAGGSRWIAFGDKRTADRGGRY